MKSREEDPDGEGEEEPDGNKEKGTGDDDEKTAIHELKCYDHH
jgi:hypothetical protein